MIKVVTSIAIVLIAEALSGCGGGEGGGGAPVTAPAATLIVTTPLIVTTLPPATTTVLSTTPFENAASVAVDTKLSITFSIENGSYLSNNLIFICGNNAVANTQMMSGNVITVTPNANLPYGATCGITWTVNGTPIGANSSATKVFSFTTAQAPLAIINLTIPTSPITPTGAITINSDTNLGNFGLSVVASDGATTISGATTIGADSRTIVFQPANKLSYNTTLAITSAVTDAASNVLGTVSGHVNVQTPVITPTLFVAALPSTFNGFNPLTLLSLSAGNAQGALPTILTGLNPNADLNSPSWANDCYGQSLNPKTLEVHLSCAYGTNPLATYDMVSGVLKAGINLPPQFTFFSPVICIQDGTCFYGFGQTSITGSDSRIVVVKNKTVTATVNAPTASRATNSLPWRMRSDGKTVFMMNIVTQLGSAAVIDRFDVASGTFNTTSINVGQEAFDMSIANGMIAVSVRRGADGKDVIFFNAATGARIGDVSLPGGEVNLLHVYGVILNNNTLYIAGSLDTVTGFIRSYTLAVDNNLTSVTTTAGPVITTPAFTYQLAFSTRLGKLYATMPTNAIYEMDAATLGTTNTWYGVFSGPGPLFIAE